MQPPYLVLEMVRPIDGNVQPYSVPPPRGLHITRFLVGIVDHNVDLLRSEGELEEQLGVGVEVRNREEEDKGVEGRVDVPENVECHSQTVRDLLDHSWGQGFVNGVLTCLN